MRIDQKTRREFLLCGGFAVGGLTPASRLVAALSSDTLTSAEKTVPARLRGLMLDAARVPEPLPYYRRVIDFCSDWQLNALQFRIADDQGCAMRFSSVPNLLFHHHAFAPEQLHELAQYGRSRGVDLIPELESFGHTGYITRSPAYAHLLDADPEQPSEFTGTIPVHPETLQLFRKLYSEIAQVFPSAYLHGGCDEVNWGGSSLSRKALQAKQRYQIWAEYLNSLNQLASGLGKQFIVWGDMVVHKEPRILPHLDKSIIVMDWNYTETSSAPLQQTLAEVRSNSCRAIGAPALISYRVGPRAGTSQLANIDAFADAYLRSSDPGSLGVILTNWVPTRYIQNSIWDGFAYAAIAFNQGTSAARTSAFQRFVEKHYGAAWNPDWEEAFQLIYAAAPQVHEKNSPPDQVPLRVPWSTDQQLAAARGNPPVRFNPFTPIRTRLEQLEKLVSKNLPDFQAFSLSVAYLQHTFWRDRAVANMPHTRQYTAALIKDIADRDHLLANALSKEWDQGRFPDSSAKTKPLFGFQPKDQLVFQFQRAAAYSASLASHPDRFLQLVSAR